MIEDYLPPSNIMFLYLLFSFLRFENQRWQLAIGRGQKGSSELVNFGVIFIGFLALIVSFGVLGVVLWKDSWQVAAGMFLLNILVGLVGGMLLSFAMRGDSFILWIISTIGILPVGALLVLNVWRAYI